MLDRIVVAALVGMVLGLVTPPVRAAGIAIESAELRLSNEFYVLDAQVRYSLSKEALEALQHGIALDVLLDVQITRERSYLWDAQVTRVRQGYRVEHHALSGQYVVANRVTGERRNFPTLAEAIQVLGEVRGIPIVQARVLTAPHRYRAYLNVRLDIEALPVPLRALAYFTSRWRLTSPTHRFSVRPG